MPIYQYRCKSCSHEFEEIQKFSDEALVTCPNCHKDTLVRIIGGAGLVFKGSGFYLTDYKRSGESGGEKKAVSPKDEGKPKSSPDSSSSSSSSSGEKGSTGSDAGKGSSDKGSEKGSGPKPPGGSAGSDPAKG